MEPVNFLEKPIIGYMYACGPEERFVSTDEAARIIMQPRLIEYAWGAKCETLDRDPLGRVIFYRVLFWVDGPDTSTRTWLTLSAVYSA